MEKTGLCQSVWYSVILTTNYLYTNFFLPIELCSSTHQEKHHIVQLSHCVLTKGHNLWYSTVFYCRLRCGFLLWLWILVFGKNLLIQHFPWSLYPWGDFFFCLPIPAPSKLGMGLCLHWPSAVYVTLNLKVHIALPSQALYAG